MLKDVTKIVVHGGQAHRDEFLTASIAMAIIGKPLPVERKDPTEEELDDPTVMVADVGGRHEPAKNNYDHHRLPRGTEECALSLLLKELGLHDSFGRIFQSYRTTVLLDCRGPIVTAGLIGIDKEQFLQTIDMLSSAVLTAWEQTDGSSSLYSSLMFEVGRSIIDYVERVMTDILAVEKSTYIVDFAGLKIMVVNGLFDSRAQDIVRRGLQWPVAVIISRDDRGAGWALFRVDDHPQVDFKILDGHSQVIFAHSSGFLAKTKPVTIDQAVGLAKLAITQPVAGR